MLLSLYSKPFSISLLYSPPMAKHLPGGSQGPSITCLLLGPWPLLLLSPNSHIGFLAIAQAHHWHCPAMHPLCLQAPAPRRPHGWLALALPPGLLRCLNLNEACHDNHFKISDFNPAIQTPLASLCFVLSTHQYLACDTVDSLWKWNEKVTQSCLALCATHGILQARILEWVDFPFSRGLFPTQGLNPGLPPCRRILYQQSHKGSPRILESVAYPFSRGSS